MKKVIYILFLVLFLSVAYATFYLVKSNLNGSEIFTFSYKEKSGPKNNFSELAKIKSIEVPILMYHYVEYVTDENDYIRESLNIEPYIFEQQLKTLKENGYVFIFPKDLPNLRNSGDLENNKYIILSFDDGYRTFYEYPFKIIEEQQAKAVVYVVSGLVDKPNYMYWSQLQDLFKSKYIEVGSHTVSHKDLTSINIDSLNYEILQSKINLQERFNERIYSFAYPYGFYNNYVIESVKKSGYTNAVTTDAGIASNFNNIYALPRLRPGKRTGKNLIKYIESNYNEKETKYITPQID